MLNRKKLIKLERQHEEGRHRGSDRENCPNCMVARCLDCDQPKSAPGVPAICAAWHEPEAT